MIWKKYVINKFFKSGNIINIFFLLIPRFNKIKNDGLNLVLFKFYNIKFFYYFKLNIFLLIIKYIFIPTPIK